MAGKKGWFGTVVCAKHGKATSKNDPTKWVHVGIPNTKRKRLNGGCPICKAEAVADKKMNRN